MESTTNGGLKRRKRCGLQEDDEYNQCFYLRKMEMGGGWIMKGTESESKVSAR